MSTEHLFSRSGLLRRRFRQFRRKLIRAWRINSVISVLLRFNAVSGHWGRRLFHYIPFLLPHDKSYFGFARLVEERDGLFLDVGANDGISALGFRHIHSDYRILSLEPNRYHERSLRLLKGRMPRFDHMIVGAGSETATKTLHMPFYKGVPIYSAASLDKTFVANSMSHQFDKNKDVVEYRVEDVKIIRIDELNLQPDIIKIDTEGYDYQVLLGLLKTIHTHRPFVMIEFNPRLLDDETAFFNALQYRFYIYDYTLDTFKEFDPALEAAILAQDKVARNIFCIPIEKLNLAFK